MLRNDRRAHEPVQLDAADRLTDGRSRERENRLPDGLRTQRFPCNYLYTYLQIVREIPCRVDTRARMVARVPEVTCRQRCAVYRPAIPSAFLPLRRTPSNRRAAIAAQYPLSAGSEVPPNAKESS
jgi:hypothetical protein